MLGNKMRNKESKEIKLKSENELFSKKINIKSIVSEEKENILKEKKINIDKKLCEMEDNRISLLNIIKKFKKENSEINKNNLFETISDFLINQNLFVEMFEEIYKNFSHNQTKLKNKITNIFLSMDDKIALLKTEKRDLQKKLGMPQDRRSENLKKLNQRLKIKIESYKEILKMKEKVIKKLILRRTIKKNYNQLVKLKNYNASIENTLLIQFLNNKQKNQKSKLFEKKNFVNSENIQNNIQKINQIFLEKDKSVISLENVSSYKSLEKVNMEKKVYKEQVIKNAILIKNTKKEMRDCKEKIQELNDGILSNELDLKMYKRSGVNNNDFLNKQAKIIELKKNKINYLKDELEDYKEKVEKLKISVQKIYKEVGGLHSDNSQKIKCYNYVVRNYLNNLKKRNFKLKENVFKIKENLNLQKFRDLKTEKLIKQYQNLQLINNTLKKRFLGIKKKTDTPPKKKKIVKKEKEVPEPENMEDIQRKTEEQKNAVNNFLGNKDDNLKEMEKLAKQLEELKNQIKNQIEEKKRIFQKVLDQKNEINDLKSKIDDSKIDIQKMEDKILEKNEQGIKSGEEIEKLQKKILSSKKSIKNIKSQKKALKKEIEKKEEDIKKLNDKISDLLKKMEEVTKKNAKIKASFENQFNSLQQIFEGSFEQYSLLENLLKKEKIYSNLLKDQKEDIKLKDKKLKKLNSKINKLEIQIKTLMAKKSTNKDFLKKYDMENEESLETKLENSTKNYILLEKKYNNFIKKNKHFEDKEKIKMKDQIDFLRRTIRDYENIIKTLRNQSETFETKKIVEKKEIDLEDFLENLNNVSGIENIEGKIEEDPFNINEPIFNQNKNFLSVNSSRKNNNFICDFVKKSVSKMEKIFQMSFEEVEKKNFNLKNKFDNLISSLRNKNWKKSMEISGINLNNNKLTFLDNILDLFIKNNCNISKDDYIEITFEKINQYLFKTKNYENENIKNKIKIRELKEKVVCHTTKIRELEDKLHNLNGIKEKIENECKNLKEDKEECNDFDEIKKKINFLEKKNMELKHKISVKSTLIMDLQKKVMEKKINKNIIIRNLDKKADFSFKKKDTKKNNEFSFKNPNPKSFKKKKSKTNNVTEKIIKEKQYKSPFSIKKINDSRNSSTKNIFNKVKKNEKSITDSEGSSLGSDFEGSDLGKKNTETFNFDETNSNMSEMSKKENKKKIFTKISNNSSSSDSNTLGSIDNDSEIKPKTDNFKFDESSAFNSKNFSDPKEEKKNSKKSNFKESKKQLEIIESVKESESDLFLSSLNESKSKLSTKKLNGIKNKSNLIKKKKKKRFERF